MSLTSSFVEGPTAFLKDYIVVVQDDSQGVPKDEVVSFFLREVSPNANYVFLVKWNERIHGKQDVIPAYWLPWQKGAANVLTLGDKAQFMFTSELTNCRFSILTDDMARPTVAHVEGTGSASKRDAMEVTAGLPARKDDTTKRMRRLSVSGIKNTTKDKSDPELHEYHGQDGAKKSSAFVFGYRADTTWKFYAQIVTGVMAGTGVDALKRATDKVVPLNEAYELA